MKTALHGVLAAYLEDAEDPVEGALVVARIINPDAEVDWVRSEISRLAESVASSGEAKPRDVIAGLAKHGFQGAKNFYEVENSALDHVLRSRQGIPISLGVIHIGVARELGLDALGVNFPRHFLVTIGDVLVDPFRVAPTSIEACRQWLKENNVSEDNAFNVANGSSIVLRMLNNVRMILQQRGDYVRALEFSDYQLLIEPDAYGLYIERADAWLSLNAPEMVVDELQKAAERAPDETVAARLRERIQQAKRLKSVVH